MIRIQNLKMRPHHTRKQLREKIAAALEISSGRIYDFTIVRRSVDAHRRPKIWIVYTVDAAVSAEDKILKRFESRNDISYVNPSPYIFMPDLDREKAGKVFREAERPVVTGSGPAGLFCALMLAREGARPIILERGEKVEERKLSVLRFWEGGELDPDSNVQFGEGGAGTFSDGKLTTTIKDPEGRIGFILRTFYHHGAPEEILYDYQPHIGTDRLGGIVRSLRSEIISLGGEFRFGTRLETIARDEKGYEIGTVDVRTKEMNHFHTGCLVLATGHSARDTFAMLRSIGMPMEPKAFACGVRVQHPQQMINDAQFGKNCPFDLGAAPYKLTGKTKSGRGVYSFCMCPGGDVVNASSQAQMTAVNGMSSWARDGKYANSAIVVTVSPEDYHGSDALDGVRFQEELERKAFEEGKGKIPVQRFADFIRNRPTVSLEKTAGSFRGETAPANVRKIFPEIIASSIEEGMRIFGKKIEGFDGDDVLLAGVESRTSSPLRILRNEMRQSDAFPGIFPCGEGAGYAGGITSAAADGIKVAEAVLTFMMNNEIIK